MLGDFPFSHSPASSLLHLRFSLSLFGAAYNFFSGFFLTPCPFYSFSFRYRLQLYRRASREDSLHQTEAGIYRFCALVCHLVSRQRQIHSQTDRSTTCSSIRVCPSVLRLRCTTCQPAVFLKEERSKWTASEIATNETTGRCHFFSSPHRSIFLFLFCEPGSTEHPDLRCVYLGQESSFMYMTPRQSRRTERGDEGRWLRTPAHSLWGHIHCCPLFFFFFFTIIITSHSGCRKRGK